MFVSVVIQAYNEEKNLPACLRALRRQTFPAERFEVIVVDNASADATAAVACRWKARVVTEPRKGVSRARQAGFQVARVRSSPAPTPTRAFPPTGWPASPRTFRIRPWAACMARCTGPTAGPANA